MIKVSVIIPVYNAEKYLDACINSVCSQTYKNIEIIIVNDGSTDNSKQIMECCASNDERIVIIDKENGGVSSARNVGLSNCLGDYYVFLDADDVLYENYIKIMLEAALNNNSFLLSCDSVWIDDKERSKALNYLDSGISNMCTRVYLKNYTLEDEKKSKFQIWGIIFKKEMFSDLRFDENIHVGEDTLYLIEAITRLGYIDFIPEKLFCHFIVGDSLEHGELNEKKLTVFESRKKMMEYGRKFGGEFEKGIIMDTFLWCERLFVWNIQDGGRYDNYVNDSILRFIKSNYFFFLKNYNKGRNIKTIILVTMIRFFPRTTKALLLHVKY